MKFGTIGAGVVHFGRHTEMRVRQLRLQLGDRRMERRYLIVEDGNLGFQEGKVRLDQRRQRRAHLGRYGWLLTHEGDSSTSRSHHPSQVSWQSA